VQIDTIDPLAQLQRRGLKLYGCIAGAKRKIYDVNLAGPTILAVGGEKRGLSGAVRSLCNRFVTIPTAGDATSMSLSHASCIIMAEAMRQRLPQFAAADDLTQTTSPDLPDPDPDSPSPEDPSSP
jgi:tRNA G18 (ribose-2'-O)-methylase SpoU